MTAKDQVRRIRAAACCRLARAGADPSAAALAVLEVQNNAAELLGHLSAPDSRHVAIVAAQLIDEDLRARLAAALPEAWRAVRPSCAALRST